MERIGMAARVLLVTAAIAGGARADVWDEGQTNDDWFTDTKNELVHGANQRHDVRSAAGFEDLDWFGLAQQPFSSYEVIVHGFTGDIDFFMTEVGGSIFRMNEEFEVLELGRPPGGGRSKNFVLRWANDAAVAVNDEYVAVIGDLCDGACTTDDQYEVVLRETTVGVPRFNNAGSQTTILIAQNGSGEPIRSTIFFWGSTGALLHSAPLTLLAKGSAAMNLAAIPELSGQGGSISIVHDGAYGLLNVKAVAVEPDTGFSFDSPGSTRGY